MAIRLLATYEFIDKDGHPAGTVRLPVVDYAQPDPAGRGRPRVLLLSGDDPYLVDFHPDSTLEMQYGTFEALLIDAVADPIPAQPGWVAEIPSIDSRSGWALSARRSTVGWRSHMGRERRRRRRTFLTGRYETP